MTELDTDRVRAFAQRMVATYSEAMTAMFVAVGHRAGLLPALAEQPSTADELASRTDTEPRYVLEWLRGLTTAGVLEHDDGVFTLPAEHAAALTSDSFMNTSAMADVVAAAGDQLDAAAARIADGSGVPFDQQAGDMVTLMHGMSRARFDTFLVSAYLPSVDGLVERLEKGIRVADVGCGTGHAARLVAAAFPASEVVGLDLSERSIAVAREAATGAGLDNLRYVATPIQDLDGQFNLVCAFDVVHDLGEPAAAVARVRAALGDDGVFLMADSAAPPTLAAQSELPWAPLMYGFSLFGCLATARSQGGEGLGTMWGHEAAEDLLRAAGFTRVTRHRMKGDPMNALYEARA